MAGKTPKSKTQKGTLGRLIKNIGRNRFLVLAALFCAMASSILNLLGTRLSGRGIDLMTGPGQVDFAGLREIVLMMILCYAFGGLLLWLTSFLANRIAYATAASFRRDIFAGLMKMPLNYFDTHQHGDIISRMTNDVDALSDGLVQVMGKFFSGLAVLVFSLLFMLAISPSVALIVLILTPLSLFVAQFISNGAASSFRANSATMGELNGYSEEMLAAQQLVTLYGYQDEAQNNFEKINQVLYKYGFRSQYFSSLVNPASRLINHIVYVAVGAVGGLLSLRRGNISVGDLSTLLIYATQFAKPINEITSVSAQFQAALAAAGRLFEMMDEALEKEDEPSALVVERAKGEVVFENVEFSYSKERRLIQGLNLLAKAGDTVAIVGPTGAGKTTLVNLLMRFYEVDKGVIFLDGKNTQDITRDSLRKQFGMVLQDSWIFRGTVRENIAYGHPSASEAEVIAAAKAAFAHGFIRRLPNGYDTIIDMQSGLSQGQLQLLTIARAMLTDPSMLILDEATSSIDTRTEREIQKALLQMMKGRTSFVIAHRLSTIRKADLILVMKDGAIIEQGRHEELMRQDSFYRQLHDSQFSEA